MEKGKFIMLYNVNKQGMNKQTLFYASQPFIDAICNKNCIQTWSIYYYDSFAYMMR